MELTKTLTMTVPIFSWILGFLLPLHFCEEIKPYVVIDKFTANEETYFLMVKNNAIVTFICDTGGHPKPEVTLRVLGSSVNLPVTQSYPLEHNVRLRSEFKIIARCPDTGRYQCVVVNSRGKRDYKNIQLGVQCPVELIPPIEDNVEKKYVVTNGSSLEIKLRYRSYRTPYKFTLYRVKSTPLSTRHQEEQKREEQHVLINSSVYTVKLNNAYESPQGEIILTILSAWVNHTGSYVFEIYNGLKVKGVYRFRMVVIDEAVQDTSKPPASNNSNSQLETTDQRPSTQACNTDVYIAVTIGIVILGFIVSFIIGYITATRRASRKGKVKTRKPATELTVDFEPSGQYDHIHRSSLNGSTYSQLNGASNGRKKGGGAKKGKRRKLAIPQKETSEKKVEECGAIYVEAICITDADADEERKDGTGKDEIREMTTSDRKISLDVESAVYLEPQNISREDRDVYEVPADIFVAKL